MEKAPILFNEFRKLNIDVDSASENFNGDKSLYIYTMFRINHLLPIAEANQALDDNDFMGFSVYIERIMADAKMLGLTEITNTCSIIQVEIQSQRLQQKSKLKGSLKKQLLHVEKINFAINKILGGIAL